MKAYCNKPEWGYDPTFIYGYNWMAQQMRQRIGEPPIEGIEYPMYYQGKSTSYFTNPFKNIVMDNYAKVEKEEKTGESRKQCSHIRTSVLCLNKAMKSLAYILKILTDPHADERNVSWYDSNRAWDVKRV